MPGHRLLPEVSNGACRPSSWTPGLIPRGVWLSGGHPALGWEWGLQARAIPFQERYWVRLLGSTGTGPLNQWDQGREGLAAGAGTQSCMGGPWEPSIEP